MVDQCQPVVGQNIGRIAGRIVRLGKSTLNYLTRFRMSLIDYWKSARPSVLHRLSQFVMH